MVHYTGSVFEREQRAAILYPYLSQTIAARRVGLCSAVRKNKGGHV